MKAMGEPVRRVQIRTEVVASREFAAIVVHLADLRLTADLVNDRQVRLARSLADSHGVELEVSPELRGRVSSALEADRRVSLDG